MKNLLLVSLGMEIQLISTVDSYINCKQFVTGQIACLLDLPSVLHEMCQ